MITVKGSSNFSFKKLDNALDQIFDTFFETDFNKDMAKSVRETIKTGKGLRRITAGTKAIRKKGLSTKPGQKGKKSSRTTPLYHTGNLLRSIKATKDGVSIIDYAKYHIEGHEVVENKWTKMHTPSIIYLKIPPRNPFLTPKGNLRRNFTVGNNKRLKKVVAKMKKAMYTGFKK